MIKNKNNICLEVLYHFCFIVYTTLSLFAFSPVVYKFSPYISQKELFTIANWVAFAVLTLIYILKPHKNKKEVLAELSVAVVFIIATFTNQTVSNVFHLTQWTMFFVVGMFIVCATVTTFKRISITSLLTTVITFIGFSYASSRNIIEHIVGYHGDMIAHYMGYYYYSHPSYYMLFAWVTYMYIRGEKKIGWIELFVEAAALYKLHTYTTCRLANVCTIAALVFYIILVKLDLINLQWKITRIVSTTAFGFASVATLLSGFIYSSSNAILDKIKGILSGRLYLVNAAFERYNIKLFGRLISPMENEGYFYLDSCYAYSLFGCGLVFFLIVIVMYSYMCYHACKTNNRHLLVCLLTLAVFGMVGDVWVHISYTPLILGFFIFLRESNCFSKSIKNTTESTDKQNPV